MSSIFDVRCSIYRDAKDRSGQYVDPQSRRIMRSMSMADFLFGGFWQDEVEAYRARLNEFAKVEGMIRAKKEPRVQELKKLLPAATLSGYFEKGRKGDLLTAHTGFIALDIDYQDNTTLSDEDIVMCLKDRPETAAIIKSCSGTGFFVMVRLAYPDKHGEQFDALVRDYARMGVALDKGCRDITRLRFASFDTAPYINEDAYPYQGICQSVDRNLLQQRHFRSAAQQQCFGTRGREHTIELVGKLVEKAVAMGKDIVNSYDEWYKTAIALSRVDSDLGRSWFHQLSRIDGQKYNSTACERQYRAVLKLPAGQIDVSYFLAQCDRYGVRIYEKRQ